MPNALGLASNWLAGLSIAFLSRIAISQAAFALAVAAWVADMTRRRAWRSVVLPAFLYPLSLYALLSAAAAAVSIDPAKSAPRLRDTLLFGMIVLLCNQVGSRRHLRILLDAIVASGVVLAIWGIAQYLTWSTDIRARISGPLSHYMTYSGLVLLSSIASLAHALYSRERHRRVIFALATACQLCALLLTRTRSAYLGLAAALTVLLCARKPRLLALAPVALVGILAVAPPPVFSRIRSIVDPRNETNVARYYLWKSGLRMIADYPLLGVGPHMVKRIYMGTVTRAGVEVGPYRDPRTPTRSDAHLHCNPLQIAAERGLPALAAWVLTISSLAWMAFGQWRRHPASAAAASAALGQVAFHVSGLFEFNFGDSEVLLMLLVLAALPYVEERLATLGR